MEKKLGVRLFDRKRQGYIATPAAAGIVEQIGQIEEQIKALETRVWRHDSQVQGTVRITATDTFSSVVLPPLLARLRDQYPQIQVELAAVNELLNIAKRDADIAVRATRSPPEMLVGHHVAPIATAVYAFLRTELSKLRARFAGEKSAGAAREQPAGPWRD
ncbi:MAG: LysR family transcriptional regulator [Gammaproteobacteria bacterium]|nr:LysR family transcriptional regulator [Gammaproteobacteria bacterium]